MNRRWIDGNRCNLLENGEAFFPRVFEVIAGAQREVLLETFILFDDKVGQQLHAVLLETAKRGVQIDITLDGFGSDSLPADFIGQLTKAGVRVHVFDPGTRILGWRFNVLRRMHRKIVVVDEKIAFVGGINYSADHLADFGPQAKQDYSVELEGPIVAHIRRFTKDATKMGQPSRRWFERRRALLATVDLPHAGSAQIQFVTRDNRDHRSEIERYYRAAIRTARKRVIIANAYFFPGYRLLSEMRKAARRGVEVNLILQGEPDMAIVKTAAALLYEHLIKAGVRIHEYCERPLHGKVAVVDHDWATVGSSNLDPLSLALNLEANVMIRDQAFNSHLAERLEHLMQNGCKEIRASSDVSSSPWYIVRSFLVFHFLRRFPAWANLLPAHAPRLAHELPPPSTHDGELQNNRPT